MRNNEWVADDAADPLRLRPRLHHRDGLRVTVGRDEKAIASVVAEMLAHRHRLGGGSRFIQQRRVGQWQAGQVAHHRLKVHQRFEPALRDLRLVRRILRVPSRVFHDVPQNHRRSDRVVIPHADQRTVHLVLARDFFQLDQQFMLAPRLADVERLPNANRRRHGRLGEVFERVVPEQVEHRADVRT